jgi:putative PIN family toxin of toxin-antitoxin system
MLAAHPPLTPANLPLLVLDTNVVLDWLVFRDPSCAALGEALRQGRVQWIAAATMQDELERVLARGDLAAWQPDVAQVRSHWARMAHMVTLAAPLAPGTPRCTDPDDQKFIDLALQQRADALLSRDRAVLRCARPALRLGLHVLTPKAWAATLP